jgi:hypothetical protein
MKRIIAFIAGLIITYFHWIGLLFGGALLGIFSKDTKWALVYGFLFGLTVWILFAINLAMMGLISKYTAMGIIFYMSILIPVLISTLSVSIRGLL